MRQTEDDPEEFEKLTFNDFLIELGLNNEQYIMALRGAVKQSFMFLPKRECKDVFVYNYNPRILQDDPSNQDIQNLMERKGLFLLRLILQNIYLRKNLDKAKCYKG